MYLDEAENDTTDYTKIPIDSSLVGEVNSELEAGKIYKIKAVLGKDGTEIGWVSNEITTTIIVTSVTLNKPTATIIYYVKNEESQGVTRKRRLILAFNFVLLYISYGNKITVFLFSIRS